MVERWLKVQLYFKLKKVVENSDGDLKCHMFSFEDAVAHLANPNPSRILTIEKWTSKLQFYSSLEL